LTSAEVSSTLPGLGIPSDLELSADGGSVGQYYSRRGATLLFIGLAVSSKSKGTLTLFVDCPNECADARGQAVIDHTLAGLAGLPQPILAQTLQARLAVTCGDGLLAPGGPERRLGKGTQAMRNIWKGLKRDPLCVWDPFHVFDIVGKKALSHPVAADFFQLVKQLEHIFGLGQGRHLDRCIASYLGVEFRACQSTGGTRKVVYLCGVPQRLLVKFRTFYIGLMAKMKHSFAHRGSYSFAKLRGIGKMLCDLPTLTFVLVLVSFLEEKVRPVPYIKALTLIQ
jgi:hypothetical protein